METTSIGSSTLSSRPGVVRAAAVNMPTTHGVFTGYGYQDPDSPRQHMALVYGDVAGQDCLVRVHSSCLTGDIFGSLRCDCGPQLEEAMRRVTAAGRGVILYLDQEGRGIGLINKLRAYELQERGLDTVEANLALGLPADARDFRVAADILRDLAIRSVHLLTNNPDKVAHLERAGVAVTARVGLQIPANPHNERYLETKRSRTGHFLDRAAPGSSLTPQAYPRPELRLVGRPLADHLPVARPPVARPSLRQRALAQGWGL